ncbi:ATP-binding protein [archaeon]|nr:ATP-binding protein [archaeon]
MIPQFINRELELRFLNDAFNSNKAELIVIYGRRRIGKTELINKFCQKKPHVYLLCTEDNEKNNLEMFRDRLADFINKPILRDIKIESWNQLFQRFLELFDSKEKVILAIDEFSFLISLNRGVVSAFQKIWDEQLKKRNIMLILAGSSISMMETEVLGYKSPLYGRRTGQWKVSELELKHIKKFFPSYNNNDLMQVYAIIGGVPAYLLELDKNKELLENIKDNILRKGKYLNQEVEFMLKQEFREQKTYLSILKQIALGFCSLGKLCAATGMDKANISKYLHVLEEITIIRHILPLGKKRKGIYLITDPFFTFWLKLVSPYQAELESGNIESVSKIIEKKLPEYMGQRFEFICEKLLLSKYFNLPLNLTSVNKWWHKEKKIDLVCLDENKKEVLFIECKWAELKERDAEQVLEELKNKSTHTNITSTREFFGIIGKKIHGKENLRKKGFTVFDIDDLDF